MKDQNKLEFIKEVRNLKKEFKIKVAEFKWASSRAWLQGFCTLDPAQTSWAAASGFINKGPKSLYF